MHIPFNVPRSKYPRKVAVDYELVYSIGTASRMPGNLMKAKGTHTLKRSSTLSALLRAHRGRPDGTQSRCHFTVLAFPLLPHEAHVEKEAIKAGQ